MTQKKAQEPKQDWGFYAVTPRVVRTQYKDLSHAEKWLYTCLKDLCGDKGSCFRSLRALSEETDISIASLSKMVPHLHSEGLIHAEKKKRSKSGKEVWHISIVDIWQANAKYCKDCSKIEQSTEKTTEVVQNMNNNRPDCSENEQSIELDCSNFSDRRIIENKGTEESTASQEIDSTQMGTPSSTLSLSSLSLEDLVAEIHKREHEQLTSSESSPETPAPNQRDTEPLNPLKIYDSEERRIHQYWQELGFEAEINVTNKGHWGKLSKHVHSFEDMNSLFKYTRRSIEQSSAKDKTVYPGNLVKCVNGWKQEQMPATKPEKRELQKVTIGNKDRQSFSYK